MSERDNIFARLREALTNEAQAHHDSGLPTVAEQRRAMPPGGVSLEEQLALFARNAADLRATFKLVNDDGELAAALRALHDAEKWRRVATHRHAEAHLKSAGIDFATLVTDAGYNKHDLEQCDVGITECDALIAQTGTVLVTTRSSGGRGLSCLPPHHVVIARREQMVADLPAAFALLKQKYGGDYPSMISFISGPSRTGDIERILVLGAHGPKKLTILCR
jgi:L-lactate dehydrogenase complex protein LldG